MKRKFVVCCFALLLSCVNIYAQKTSLGVKSHYKETMTDKMLTKNAVKDYKMKSSDTEDQSGKLQSAIDEISKKGGGKLIIPKGTYRITDIYMKSNVHILIDKDAILKPATGNSNKNMPMITFSSDDKNEGYIENCSIRCLQKGERYTVDYSYLSSNDKMRFIVNRLVKNFLIADANIYDNFTTYCGIIFVPTTTEGADKWKLSRPTFGEVRNCSLFKGRTGYGFCQLHGAQTLYFENIYSNGGVTLRLESGAGGPYAGVFDIQAKNVITENGRAGVMMNPHATHNGTVKIDGVKSLGSGYAVMVHGGFIDRKHQNNPNATKGTYANDSEIINIYAKYGENCQIDEKQIYTIEPLSSEYAKVRDNDYGDFKSVIGPSCVPVLDCTNGNYKVTYGKISSEGFAKNYNYVVYEETIEDRKKINRELFNNLPAVKNRTPEQAAIDKEARKKQSIKQKAKTLK